MPMAGCEPDGFSCFLAVRIFLLCCNSLLLLVIFAAIIRGHLAYSEAFVRWRPCSPTNFTL